MLKNTMIIAAALVALAGPAFSGSDGRATSAGRYETASDDDARCAARPDAQVLSVEQLSQKLKDQGYALREFEWSHGCYEVKATDAQGVRIKMYVDPSTAEIVSRKGRT